MPFGGGLRAAAVAVALTYARAVRLVGPLTIQKRGPPEAFPQAPRGATATLQVSFRADAPRTLRRRFARLCVQPLTAASEAGVVTRVARTPG